MQLVVVCNNAMEKELLPAGCPAGLELISVAAPEEALHYSKADACIDLLFENARERIALLKSLNTTILINEVTCTLHQTDPSYIRINGWPGFLSSSLVEASSLDKSARDQAAVVFSALNKTPEWLPDEPGFITPRVVSMIINEAYFALSEGVSTREEIDTAMKLGTAYPFGPFEWAEKIGLAKIASLLRVLAKEQERYTPCPLLISEAARAEN